MLGSVFAFVAFVLPSTSPPPLGRLPARPTTRFAIHIIRASSANDGEDVDWDKEAAALAKVTGSDDNKFFTAIKEISAPELVSEFAQTAPPDVQLAVKTTIGQLLGNLPAEIADSTITTPGKNLGSLLFSMQMTGYMFRNAEYRRSLRESLDERGSKLLQAGDGQGASTALPPVSGTISVKIAEGMQAEVDAAAYMAELRQEVEELRGQLVDAKQQKKDAAGGALLSFIQTLEPKDVQSLTSQVSEDVLEAMGQLVASLLIDLNVPLDESTTVEAPKAKLRELLITQLVTGYKLREMEVRDEIKDKFWS